MNSQTPNTERLVDFIDASKRIAASIGKHSPGFNEFLRNKVNQEGLPDIDVYLTVVAGISYRNFVHREKIGLQTPPVPGVVLETLLDDWVAFRKIAYPHITEITVANAVRFEPVYPSWESILQEWTYGSDDEPPFALPVKLLMRVRILDPDRVVMRLAFTEDKLRQVVSGMMHFDVNRTVTIPALERPRELRLVRSIREDANTEFDTDTNTLILSHEGWERLTKAWMGIMMNVAEWFRLVNLVQDVLTDLDIKYRKFY